jgi:histidyl-tRNA synthetase
MTEIIRSVKGTRDFYPENMAVRRWILIRSVLFQPALATRNMKGPAWSLLTLYAANLAKSWLKNRLLCSLLPGMICLTLRPELTPTLARMVAQSAV